MNIRNNKGITSISLVVTIIILSILAFVTVKITMGITQVVKFQNIETYMLLIQSQCETLSNDIVIGEKSESDLYGERQMDGSKYGWYRLSQSDLNALGVEKANASDGYYVKYSLDENSTVDVRYEKGVSDEGVTYYTLSEIIAAGK